MKEAKGEVYFWEHVPGTDHHGTKLAQSSMVALCELLLCPSPRLRKLADELIEETRQYRLITRQAAIDAINNREDQ